MSIHTSRTIQRHGIEYLGLHYAGSQLEALKLRHPNIKTFSIRVDPEDLSFIRVIDPQTMRPIRVACTSAKSGPFPRREHILSRKAASSDAQAIRQANAEASARRSQHFQETDQAALEKQARNVAEAQAAARAATRQRSPQRQKAPDAKEASVHRALQVLKDSEIRPESRTATDGVSEARDGDI